jgi:gamma-glutamyltranspeptidase/glutathione hydrolase
VPQAAPNLTVATESGVNSMPTIAESSFSFTRTAASGRGGAVAGKSAVAVDAGIAMLQAGGNAFDAAVATAFAMGVAEPWMNGIGGGGYLVGWLAIEQRAFTIEYPMISPLAATADMYPLAGGVDAGLFGWPKTVDNANVLGFKSVAVPGTVHGLCLALERYGTLPLSTVLAPAIALAEDGVDVTWHTTYMITRDQANLRRFAGSADIYLDGNGNPPFDAEGVTTPKLRNPALARTLRAIADGGAAAFYTGSIAQSMVEYLASGGTPIAMDDFTSYEAEEDPGIHIGLEGYTVHTIGKGTGGTTLVEALGIAQSLNPGADAHNSPAALHKLTHAFRQAFADRFTYLGDPDHVEVPIPALLDAQYHLSRAERFEPETVSSTQAGDRIELGVIHNLGASVADYMRDGSTTHLGVIDADGNAVSITQTLLSGWGSRVTVPDTGVLLNNGMMWFDPEPGRPNSVAGRKRPLTNMSPALLVRDGRIVASVGSSGGRKIMNCNAQLLLNLATWGMTMDEALNAPRIDTSTRKLNVSARLAPSTVDALRAKGHDVDLIDETLLAGSLASPVAIRRSAEGDLEAVADAWYFPAAAKVLT